MLDKPPRVKLPFQYQANLTAEEGVVQRRFAWYDRVMFAVFAIVAGAAIAQAIREDTWQPIWQVGWLPAVLVASVSRPQRAGDCRRRLRRHSDP